MFHSGSLVKKRSADQEDGNSTSAQYRRRKVNVYLRFWASFEASNLGLLQTISVLLPASVSSTDRVNKEQFYKNTVVWRRLKDGCKFGAVGGEGWDSGGGGVHVVRN